MEDVKTRRLCLVVCDVLNQLGFLWIVLIKVTLKLSWSSGAK